eukprot:gene9638-7551_t
MAKPTSQTPAEPSNAIVKRRGSDRRDRSVNKQLVHVGGGAVVALAGLKLLRAIFGGGNLEDVSVVPPAARSPAEALRDFTRRLSTTFNWAPPHEEKWAPVEILPPDIPKDYKSIATATMPCCVHDFFDHVVSSQSDYFRNTHSKAGCQRSMNITAWKPSGTPSIDDKSILGPLDVEVFDYVLESSGTGGYCRTMSFVQPRKPPSPVDASCVQRQQYNVYAGDVLVFATAMNMLNIPFRECFSVNTIWMVKPEGESGNTCSVTIYMKVHFTKNCLVAGLIRSSASADTAQFYRGFLKDTSCHMEAITSGEQVIFTPRGQAHPRPKGFDNEQPPGSARSPGSLTGLPPSGGRIPASIMASARGGPSPHKKHVTLAPLHETTHEGPDGGLRTPGAGLPRWAKVSIVFGLLAFIIWHQWLLRSELIALRAIASSVL